MLPYMLEYGADYNARDENGRTALVNAVSAGQSIEVVQMLVASGADPLVVTT